MYYFFSLHVCVFSEKSTADLCCSCNKVNSIVKIRLKIILIIVPGKL